MPAKSKAQFRFMEMLAHNKDRAKEVGMSSHKAEEYVSNNTGEKSYKDLPEKKKPKFDKIKKLMGGK